MILDILIDIILEELPNMTKGKNENEIRKIRDDMRQRIIDKRKEILDGNNN
ncbi:hypothetical protein HN803_02655 [candidate division WWE3 bacterium]|jgi:hypothetical protein|nr:hypothetical protein [candidate division WWE3 bacterium]